LAAPFYATLSVPGTQYGLLLLFERATDTGGNIEGIHDQVGSPASLLILIDEAKTVDADVLHTFLGCTTSFRLFMSSTGQASGGFYQIMTAKSHLWKTFTVTLSMRGL
jgi:hypothetical protein